MQRFKVVYRRYQDPLSIRTWGKGNWTQLLLANQFAQFVGWGGRHVYLLGFPGEDSEIRRD